MCFAKLRKATIVIVISVRPPARMEQIGPDSADFYVISYSRIFQKSDYKI
jgi:hypothetical protein